MSLNVSPISNSSSNLEEERIVLTDKKEIASENKLIISYASDSILKAQKEIKKPSFWNVSWTFLHTGKIRKWKDYSQEQAEALIQNYHYEPVEIPFQKVFKTSIKPQCEVQVLKSKTRNMPLIQITEGENIQYFADKNVILGRGKDSLVKLWIEVGKPEASARKLAIKMNRNKLPKNPETIKEKQEELLKHEEALKQTQAENCPYVEQPSIGVFELEKHLGKVVELARGDLKSIIKKLKPEDKNIALSQLAQGLSHFHSHKKWLGDIKPENVLYYINAQNEIVFCHADTNALDLYNKPWEGRHIATERYRSYFDDQAKDNLNQENMAQMAAFYIAKDVYGYGVVCLNILSNSHKTSFLSEKSIPYFNEEGEMELTNGGGYRMKEVYYMKDKKLDKWLKSQRLDKHPHIPFIKKMLSSDWTKRPSSAEVGKFFEIQE